MKQEIEARLSAIERDKNVRVLLAVESGSRAWGFPSPDSDWDVRFIYAHPVEWYLQVRDRRDVIEEADGLLDVSGWDARKAVGLILKSNASALEWLKSPVVYRDTPEAAILREFAARASLGGVQRHYFYLARSIWRERFASGGAVNIKKYFYLIRPALALRYMRLTGLTPPMALPALIAGTALTDDTSRILASLVARKAVSKEFDEISRFAEIDALCVSEMDAAEVALEKDRPVSEEAYSDGDTVFRRVIGWTS